MGRLSWGSRSGPGGPSPSSTCPPTALPHTLLSTIQDPHEVKSKWSNESAPFFSVVSPSDVAGAGTPFEAPSFSPEPNGFTSVTPSPLRSSPTPCPPSGLLGKSLRLLCWPGNQGDVSLLQFPRQHVLLGDGVTAKHTHTHTHTRTCTMVKKRRKYSLFAIGLIRASDTVTAPGTL